MNRKAAFLLSVCSLLITSAALASSKPTIGVADFRNDSAAAWWYGGAGSDLSSMLTNELATTEKFRVVERSKLEHVP